MKVKQMGTQDYLQKKLAREIKARKEAERIMEEKSLELYYANEKLKKLNQELNKSLLVNIDALEESESEKFALFENAAVGVVFTINDKIIKINNTLTEGTGLNEEDITGSSIYSILYKNDIEGYQTKLNEIHSNLTSKFNIQARIKKANQSYLWCNFHVSNVVDVNGDSKYTMHIIENIQEKKTIKAKQETLISQLKEINSQLESFAHVVSHDLKAPLNGMHTVMGWIRKYMDKKGGVDDEMTEYIYLIDDRVRKMYTLIEGVMEYSKVSQLDEKKEYLCVKNVIEETLQLLTIPNHIQIRYKGDFPSITVNRHKLKQVFLNLVDNALRHNDKKEGFIEIRSKENVHYWIFEIEDNGVGIPNKYINKIFKIFNTLDTSGKHTGIGLALVTKIIEHYGGKISVDSVPSEKTIFTFTLDKDTVSISNET